MSSRDTEKGTLEPTITGSEPGGGIFTFWLRHPQWDGFEFRLTYTPSGHLVDFEVGDSRVIARTGNLLPTELPLEPEQWLPPPATVGTRRLREVPLGDLDRVARREVAKRWGRLDPEMLDQFEGPARSGRAGRPDEFYVPLVIRYLELVVTSPHPIPDLGKEVNHNAKTVRNWMSEARRRGLLAGSTRGTAGGYATAKCLELYDAMTTE